MSMTLRSSAPLDSSSVSVVSRNRRRVRWARRPMVRPSVATTSGVALVSGGCAIDGNPFRGRGHEVDDGVAHPSGRPPGGLIDGRAPAPSLHDGDLGPLHLEGLAG